jgi:hypothetical protein
MIEDFLDMMPHTVQHAPMVSRDDYGKVTYGTAVPYRSRVVYKNARVRKSDGTEVIARGMVWLSAAVTVNVDDKITLPDASTPPILSWEMYPDDEGFVYTKIYFG